MSAISCGSSSRCCHDIGRTYLSITTSRLSPVSAASPSRTPPSPCTRAVSTTPGQTALAVSSPSPSIANSHASVPGEADDPVLRGAVGRVAGAALLAGDRGDVDDPPGPRLDHLRNHGLGNAVGADEVDVEGRPPHILVAVPGERPLLTDDARVFDENVDAPQALIDLRDRGGDVLAGGDVGLHGGNLCARRMPLDLGRDVRDRRVDVESGDVRARGGERLHDRPADALLPAGHQCDLAVQLRAGHRTSSLMFLYIGNSLRLVTPTTSVGPGTQVTGAPDRTAHPSVTPLRNFSMSSLTPRTGVLALTGATRSKNPQAMSSNTSNKEVSRTA